MKYTIGLRLSLDDELRGSDDVDHNIRETIKPNEHNHMFGKKLEHSPIMAEKEKLIHVEMVKRDDSSSLVEIGE